MLPGARELEKDIKSRLRCADRSPRTCDVIKDNGQGRRHDIVVEYVDYRQLRIDLDMPVTLGDPSDGVLESLPDDQRIRDTEINEVQTNSTHTRTREKVELRVRSAVVD
jgi:hypothetical protein